MKNQTRYFLILTIVVLFAFSLCSSFPKHERKLDHGFFIERYEELERNGRFQVGWKYFPTKGSIVFEIVAETLGFVGFGISPNGGMEGSDIVIGGVDSATNEISYFKDFHGIGHKHPIEDEILNWNLINASENGTHTYVKFSRKLNTCDENDVQITNGTTHFIWAIGNSDKITYHGISNRGTYGVNILDPPIPPIDLSKLKSWQMLVDTEMPANETTYWCTIHKSPQLFGKHHIVGFSPYLETPEALKYTHHLVMTSCTPPQGTTAQQTFEQYVGSPGTKCYEFIDEILPEKHCKPYLFAWAVGGKTIIWPDHVGYPMNENEEYGNYYLLEVHYNNPELVSGIRFTTGLEIFYTDHLRKYDAGTLTVGHNKTWTLTIPPNSADFVIAGHCSPDCSSNIPKDGIFVFNILLHSHISGKKLKLRHFRDNLELPWIGYDENYNFNFQQNRPLAKEVKIMPGDHLIIECTYDNTWNDGKSVIGGLSTTEEMCVAVLWYYPSVSLVQCFSEFPRAVLLEEFGIGSMSGDWRPSIISPKELAGKYYQEILDTKVSWDYINRLWFQEELRFGQHANVCWLRGHNGLLQNGKNISVMYPYNRKEYKPSAQC